LTWLATPTNVRNIPASGKGPIIDQVFQLDKTQAPGKVEYAFYGVNSGCTSARVNVLVTVLPASPDGIFIPELITPNGDGLNDTWEIVVPESIANPELYAIRLFNRYGSLVYESNLANTFNADTFPDGSYYYVLSKPDGETIRGAVSILRRR
jgi:gliding motility-associated-like protein